MVNIYRMIHVRTQCKRTEPQKCYASDSEDFTTIKRSNSNTPYSKLYYSEVLI